MARIDFLHLENSSDIRPIFLAEVNKVPHICLLDTDAKLSMFYGEKILFDSYFSGNATLYDKVEIITA